MQFILKGGFLIAAMVGLDTRATMDMDATIKGLPVNEQTVREMATAGKDIVILAVHCVVWLLIYLLISKRQKIGI